MPRPRVYVPVTTREYAELHGISIRAAQRQVKAIPGATKGRGNRWNIPITATQYARLKGISPSTARRRGVRSATLDTFKQYVLNQRRTTRAVEKAVTAYVQLLSTDKSYVNVGTVEDRMLHASPRQLREIAQWEEWDDVPGIFDDEWEGDDDLPILFYH